MNKKFLSAILCGALALASTSTFVSCKDYDDEVNNLQEQMDKANTVSASLQTKLNAAEASISALESAKSALEAQLAKCASADEAAKLAASIATLEGAQAKLQEAIDGKASSADVVAAIAKIDAAIVSANAYTDAAVSTLEELISKKANKSDLDLKADLAALNEVKTNVETVKGNLEVMIDTKVNSLNDKLTNAIADMAKLQAAIDAQDAAIKAIKDWTGDIANGDAATLAAAQQAINAAKAELEGKIASINTVVESTVDAAKLAAVESKADLANSTIAELQSALESKADGAAIDAIEEKVKAIEEDKIPAIIAQINAIDKNLNVISTIISKQLKSLVYCPTYYLDGIETIKFITLRYEDWANAWEADAPATGNFFTTDNESKYEEYFVNPRNVDPASIEKFEFVSNKAANDTRAVADCAPIAVASWEIGYNENKAYVAKLNLKKTVTTTFGGKWGPWTNDEFTTVALKATLKDKVDGEEVNIYSDWARLAEESVRPYIHNKISVDASGNYYEYNWDNHFWSFSQLYSDYGTQVPKTSNVLSYNSNNYNYIAKQVYYKDSIDLMSLVDVCIEHNEPLKDWDKYGLAFEFHVMDYNLKNNNSTVDYTNQKHFAKLDGTILSSCARDGQTANNRDAIGRQPAIQAVLKDTKNGKVVDVRYFKIQWVDEVKIENWENIGEFESTFDCGAGVSNFLKEEVVNGFYTKVDMTRDEFHQSYGVSYMLYPTYEDAVKTINGDYSLGHVNDLYDASAAGQTHNYQWTIDGYDLNITQADYDKGYKEIVAYGYFYKYINQYDRKIFNIKVKVNIPKMAYKGKKDMPMWTDLTANNAQGGMRHVNPQLESDPVYGNSVYATTQIFGSLLQGYIDNGNTPAFVDELVNKGTASLQFDEAGCKAALGNTWNVQANGTALYNGTVLAATITSSNRIQLYESENGSATSEPSSAAKELIGKAVKVKLADTWCGFNDVLDVYDVHFMTPLTFNAVDASVVLTDVTPGGSSEGIVEGKLEIKEAFNTAQRIVWDNLPAATTKRNPTLISWYRVEDITAGAIKTNVKTDGTIGANCETPIANIKNADSTPKYIVTYDPATNKVTFINKSGNALGQEIQFIVPVTVNTKWTGSSLNANIKVTVKPFITSAKTR